MLHRLVSDFTPLLFGAEQFSEQWIYGAFSRKSGCGSGTASFRTAGSCSAGLDIKNSSDSNTRGQVVLKYS